MRSFRGSASGPLVCYSITMAIDPPNRPANTGAYLDMPVDGNPGCVVGQRVFINPQADYSTPGYSINDVRVSATNIVRGQTLNVTAGALDPAALSIAFVFLGERAGV